jgi:hypothetical protein
MARASAHLAEEMMEPFRYDKPGARIAIYPDRLEMTTGFLWAKKTHVVPLRAVTGISVAGLGGKTLRIETAGRAYDLEVGVGVAAKIRQRIIEALPR